jgi:hypothetical protein
MRRLCVLLCALVAVAGCASDGSGKSQWDEFWKDLRGENMEMKSGRGMKGAWDDFGSMKPGN